MDALSVKALFLKFLHPDVNEFFFPVSRQMRQNIRLSLLSNSSQVKRVSHVSQKVLFGAFSVAVASSKSDETLLSAAALSAATLSSVSSRTATLVVFSISLVSGRIVAKDVENPKVFSLCSLSGFSFFFGGIMQLHFVKARLKSKRKADTRLGVVSRSY